MLNKLRLRLRALFFKSKMEDELDQEVRFHLERETEENVARGMTPEEARSAALRSFGGVERVKEESRDVWGIRLVEELWQDLRYSARMLLKGKTLTTVAVVSLALGIGANTAIFSLVSAVLWRPLPYPHAERLVTLGGGTSAPDFIELAEQSRTLECLSAFETRRFVLTGGGAPIELRGQRISTELLSLLGVNPTSGRAFAVEEFQPGREQVALISQRLWQNRFGADPRLIGRAVTLDERSYTVVGVLPPSFTLFPASDLLTPLAMNAEQLADDSSFPFDLIARLKPGVSIEHAQRELNEIRQRSNQRLNFRITPLRDQLVSDSRRTLFMLWGVIALVLLIACVNFANLLLARAANRHKEIAIRAALGARRGRLARQLLTESLLLAVLGGVLGLLCAYYAIHALVVANPAAVPSVDIYDRPGVIPRLGEVGINWWVIGFTFTLSALTGAVFGLAPALQFSKPDLNRALKEGAAVSGAGFQLWRHHCKRSLLVISEIALALMLLIGAGLLARSFWRLQQVKPGFQPDKLLTLQLEFPWSRYRAETMVNSFVTLLSENLPSLPGVESVGATSNLPFTSSGLFSPYSIEGRPNIDQNTDEDLPFGAFSPPPPPPGGAASNPNSRPLMGFNSKVSPGYFRTMGIPLRRGRVFDPHDDEHSPSVVIINEAMAQRFWPGEDPLGKRIALGQGPPWLTIVGVVGNVKQYALEDKTRPEFYRPFAQSAESKTRYDKRRASMDTTDTVSLVIRAAGRPDDLAEAVQKLVWEFDQDQPIQRLSTMEKLIAEASAPRRFNLLLFVVAAGVAVLLAGVGIYGMMAHLVAQRTHELGIRLALGAQRGDVLRLVILQGLQPAFAGLALGLAAALALTRLLKNLLFGVSATDPLTFAVIALLLVFVALLACWIPARRATKVDPMIVLRSE